MINTPIIVTSYFDGRPVFGYSITYTEGRPFGIRYYHLTPEGGHVLLGKGTIINNRQDLRVKVLVEENGEEVWKSCGDMTKARADEYFHEMNVEHINREGPQ